MATPARPTRPARALLALAAVATLGFGAYALAIEPNLAPKRFGVVEPGVLYRSGEGTPAALARVIRDKRIKTIIDFGAHEPDSPEERREARTAEALGVTRVVLRLEGDATGNLNNYARALEIMRDPARQPVLVHCAAGAQRTGCAVALYRMDTRGDSVDHALAEAARFDHDPADNPHLGDILRTHGQAILDAAASGGQVPGFDPVPTPLR